MHRNVNSVHEAALMCPEHECRVRTFVPGRSSCARSSQGVGQVTGECLSFSQVDQGAFCCSGAQTPSPMGWQVLGVKPLSFWGIGCITVPFSPSSLFSFSVFCSAEAHKDLGGI